MPKINTPDICVFHKDCIDGMAAAFFVWIWRPQCQFIPGVYGKPLEVDWSDKHILLVDFSYSKDYTVDLLTTAKSVTIIDHHKSFFENFYVEPEGFVKVKGLEIIYDANECGASLVFKTIYPDGAKPILLNYIRDRDLWLKELPETDTVHAYLSSLPPVFEDWYNVFYDTPMDDILISGEAIYRSEQKLISDLLEYVFEINIAGYQIPCLNIPKKFASNALAELNKNVPFAANMRIEGTDMVFDLRSDKNYEGAIDVSEIAKKFGGGGHQHSAGFSIKNTIKHIY